MDTLSRISVEVRLDACKLSEDNTERRLRNLICQECKSGGLLRSYEAHCGNISPKIFHVQRVFDT